MASSSSPIMECPGHYKKLYSSITLRDEVINNHVKMFTYMCNVALFLSTGFSNTLRN
jgi:hypothetical protein